MRILLVNKFHYLKGGSETYYFNLKELLEEHGHEVIEFSMKDSRNLPSNYSEYFVDNVEYNKKNSSYNKIKLAIKLVYSFEARRKMEKLIIDYKPNIAHLNIFQHQLSPSILGILKKYNIPIVYTAHDFKMICPNYKMMLPSGEICEDCKGGRYYNCLKNKCVKNSSMNSFVDMIEAYTHKILKSYDRIDKIITPSNFYKKKFIEFGTSSDKIAYIPNFLDGDKYIIRDSCKDYFIYFGRLSDEKGIKTLIRAMKDVKGKLKVVGTGPMEKELKEYTKEQSLDGKIEYLGYKTGDELKRIIQDSRFIVVPSKWYENAPYSILEAMAMGKPVLGSNMGGIPELVRNNETGLIFQTNDYKELTDKINLLLNNENLIKLYGRNARNIFDNMYNKETHYESILHIYEEQISRR